MPAGGIFVPSHKKIIQMKRKLILYVALVFSVLYTGCKSSQESVSISDKEKQVFQQSAGDPVVISDKKTEYEIIIIDPGFYSWLKSFAKPEGYYSQTFMENRNEIYVTIWNQRVLMPGQYDPNLYELSINYDPRIDYGYEVNYKLYNYFIYFQRKYNQRLGPYLPRI